MYCIFYDNEFILQITVYSQRYDNKVDAMYEDLYYLYNPHLLDPYAYQYRSNQDWQLNMTKVAIET